MKDKDKDKEKGLDFEKALADLEGIVEKLEKGGLGLNESLGVFEKGVTLARYLRAELDKAEKKIEILLKSEKGGLRAEPFSLEEAEGEGRPGGGAKAAAPSAGGAEDEEDGDEKEDGEDDGEGGEGDVGEADGTRRAGTRKRPGPRAKKADDDSELPF
ncbi:MAG: exodeoxyribonuclease VII small subunit [Candidatus Aminicenantes bacterium]|nr:exodeoxyribonuclease VII small subunit [Candidatus Aminicenantes bacterium]